MLGAYFCLNMVLITLSSFLSVTVINIYMREDQTNKVPGWLRKVSLTSKARYTLSTKLNSTRSTLLKVDCCRNRQQIGNKVDCRRYVQLCYRYGRLCRQCVRRQSNTVDLKGHSGAD